jgi:hypothetical protein
MTPHERGPVPTRHHSQPQKAENPAICRLSLQADEGIRTLDLRHGKATL